MDIRMSGTVAESIVDGPGIRFTVFVQGCPHNCPGCHNPHTHDFNGGYLTTTEELFEEISKNPLIDGVTFSGGEPFNQAVELADLADKLEGSGLNIITFSGYTYEYLLEHSSDENGYLKLLKKIDILIDGKFDINQKSYELKFKGSKNQRVIDCKESLRNKEVIEIEF